MNDHITVGTSRTSIRLNKIVRSVQCSKTFTDFLGNFVKNDASAIGTFAMAKYILENVQYFDNSHPVYMKVVYDHFGRPRMYQVDTPDYCELDVINLRTYFELGDAYEMKPILLKFILNARTDVHFGQVASLQDLCQMNVFDCTDKVFDVCTATFQGEECLDEDSKHHLHSGVEKYNLLVESRRKNVPRPLIRARGARDLLDKPIDLQNSLDAEYSETITATERRRSLSTRCRINRSKSSQHTWDDADNTLFDLGEPVRGSPTYKVVRECENFFRRNRKKNKIYVDAELQAFQMPVSADMMKFLKDLDGDYVLKLIEDLSLLLYKLIHARVKSDYFEAIVSFAKLRINTSLVGSAFSQKLYAYFMRLFDSEPELQGDDNKVSQCFASLRDYLTQYEAIKESPLFQKMYRFLMYCLSLSLFDKVGITLDSFRYTKVEQEALRKKYYMGVDFIHSCLDTILFLCERGHQCILTGTLDPIFHSSQKYEEWYTKAEDLRIKSNFLSNPEPHGFTTYEFRTELEDILDQGKAMQKYANDLGNFQKTLLKRMISDLGMIKATEITKRAAQKSRKAPFCTMLYGASSVGKSTLKDLLIIHYCKVHNLPMDEEYFYTRMPGQEFWPGFTSGQHTCVLDDVAFMRPQAAPNGDPTMMEALWINNNVNFVVNQAAIEDKGKTPFLCEHVVGTTNTEHLNAYSYFSCPLAAQRRFPWVIEVEPKPEYRKDGIMLDPTKLPPLAPNSYPDFWILTVKRVIPHGKNQAQFETVQVYDDINRFISWYSKASIAHKEIQEDAMDCVDSMRGVKACEVCFSPNCVCELQVESDDVAPGVMVDDEKIETVTAQERTAFEQYQSEFFKESLTQQLIEFVHMWVVIFLVWLCQKSICFATMLYSITKYTKFDLIAHLLKDTGFGRIFMRSIGNQVHRKIGKYDGLIKIAIGISTCASVYYLCHQAYKNFFTSSEKQGNCMSKDIGKKPKPDGSERVNVWYKNDYVTSDFDVSSQTTSLQHCDRQEVERYFERNVVQFVYDYIKDGNLTHYYTKAVCVGGHNYLFNDHSIPAVENFVLHVISGPTTSGVNQNIEVMVITSEIKRMPEKDLAMINLRSIPPKKNIVHFFQQKSLRGNHKGFYLSRNREGQVVTKDVENVNYIPSIFAQALRQFMPLWAGKCPVETQPGDCGSLLLSRSEFGPIILGIHMLGKDNGCYSTPVSYDDVVQLIGDEPIIESNSPMLDGETVKREVGDLDYKSPIRFIEDGVAEVYGSMIGFRPKPKSRVCDTFIKDSVIKSPDYEQKHGQPEMRGYVPWRTALLDMVNPVTKIDTRILGQCVNSFTEDILSEIKGDLEHVFVYDDDTALNGAAGVLYVDKINRSTSAGLPWRKSKKHFLRTAPPKDGLQDRVEVVEEISERVNEIISRYQEGKRACPAFCAHLKDEPTSFKKIKIGKTRVFTGAPFDWSLVVRKYLLSIIRLIQSNRFVFESAPGTIAQSTEWNEIREYLVKFGEDRIVAGDYKAFDKRMPSTIILAAFDIILNICREAGYSDSELLVVRGIAEDTAFPIIEFNGDLIQCYGSNPSGHPLTVIINGLANALYMRYCYAVLNPDKNCKDFKRHVALMTYGDDNIMGVSPDCDFFDHTKIQDVLDSVGITYTMADKEAESVPFIHINEANFLKRTWRDDVDVGTHLCPLDHDSISKMLTTCVRSKTITPEAQAIAVIETALREYFWYGKTIFNTKREFFKDIVKENNLENYVEDSTFPTWEFLKEQFWENSKKLE